VVVGVLGSSERFHAASGTIVQTVKCRTQIDEERVGCSTSPRADVSIACRAQVVDALRSQGVIVGHGAGANIAGNCNQRLAGGAVQRNGLSIPDHGNAEGLLQTKTGSTFSGERSDSRGHDRSAGRDRRGRVCRRNHSGTSTSEADRQSGIQDVGLEAELEGDSRQGVLFVVYVDLIDDRRIEREIVRSIARLQERVDAKESVMSAVWSSAVMGASRWLEANAPGGTAISRLNTSPIADLNFGMGFSLQICFGGERLNLDLAGTTKVWFRLLPLVSIDTAHSLLWICVSGGIF